MISILGIILVIGSIVLYKSYAFYKEEKIYNILQGKVPEFNYDLKLAVTLDGEKVESIPVKEENVYYQVNVTCNEGTGKWNYTKWLVEVSDFSSNTKCNVAFTKAEEEIKDPEEETHQEISKIGGWAFGAYDFAITLDREDKKDLTNDNFFLVITGVGMETTGGANYASSNANYPGLSYNSNTGVLSVSGLFTTINGIGYAYSAGEVYLIK